MNYRRLKDSKQNKSLIARRDWMKKAYKLATAFVAVALLSSALTLTVIGSTPTGFSTVLEPGSLVEEARYTVFQSGGVTYIKNGTTGEIEYSSSSDYSAFYEASNNSGMGDMIFVKNGTYELPNTLPLPVGVTLKSYGANLNISANAGEAFTVGTTTSAATEQITEISGFNVIGDDGVTNTFINVSRIRHGFLLSEMTFYDVDNIATVWGDCYNAIFEKLSGINCVGVLLRFGTLSGETLAPNNAIVRDCEFSNTLALAGTSTAIQIEAHIHHITIVNCWFENFYTCISDNGKHTTINNCILSPAGAYGVHMQGNQTILSNSIVSPPPGSTGVFINATRIRANIESNIFRLFNTYGITSNGYLSYTSAAIVGNNFMLESGTPTCIYGSFLYSTIVDNIFYGIPTAPAGKAVDIFSTMVTPTQNVIATNVITGLAHTINGTSMTYSLICDNTIQNYVYGVSVHSTTIVKDNIGYVTENSGSQTITGAVNTVDVTHGLVASPTMVIVTGNNTLIGNSTVTAITSTTFTISFENQPDTRTWTFYWYAEVR